MRKFEVVIRTNGGTLTVNAPSSSVYHYNNLDTLTIQAVAANSYHETGAVINVANLTSGRIVVEAGGYMNTINAESSATVVVDGYVNTVTGATATGNGYVPNNNGGTLGSASSVDTKIKTIADLHRFRDRVNVGQDFSLFTVTLASDLDLTGALWTPIGNSLHPFVGTFDGQNHVIKGLTNAGYESDDSNVTFTTTNSMATGYAYGFFGIVGSLTETGDVTLKNVKMESVDINCVASNMCGALVGADVKAAKNSSGNAINGDYAGNITIENVTVTGSIKALDSVGGIAGKFYTNGRVTLSKCVNEASVSNDISANNFATSNYKVSGLLAYRNLGTTTIKDCVNKGAISKAGKGFGSAVANLGYKLAALEESFIHSGNSNTGSVSWKKADGTIDTSAKNHLFNYDEAGRVLDE